MKIEDRKPTRITRRQFAKLGGTALTMAAVPWFARSASAEEPKLVTDIPENEAILGSLQFVSVSEKEGQSCGNCILYTAGENGVGKCTVLQQGVVPEGGWCLSWAKKP